MHASKKIRLLSPRSFYQKKEFIVRKRKDQLCQKILFKFGGNMFGPVLSLVAGILILIFPRILNYVVAIYLILIGLMGLLGFFLNRT